MATKVEGKEIKRLSGQYHYGNHTGLFHYVKKTGYLVKSPSSAMFGRWRKRWFMLVDLVAPEGQTGTPSREVRLEYYTENICSKREKPKLKGYLSLRGCIAVVNHDKKMKGHNFVFNVIMNNLTVYHLAANSEKERNDWVTAMNDFVFSKPQMPQEYFLETDIVAPSTYVDFVTSAYYNTPPVGNLPVEEEKVAAPMKTESQELTRKRSGSFSFEKMQQSRSSAMASNGSVTRQRLFSEQTAVRDLGCEEYGSPGHYRSGGSERLRSKGPQQTVVADSTLPDYDYVDDQADRMLYKTESHSRQSSSPESEPDSIYWNDSLVPSKIKPVLLEPKDLQRSQSSEGLLQDSKLYKVGLPPLDSGSHWSLSSEEGETKSNYEASGMSKALTSSATSWKLSPPTSTKTASNLTVSSELQRSVSSPNNVWNNPNDSQLAQSSASEYQELDHATLDSPKSYYSMQFHRGHSPMLSGSTEVKATENFYNINCKDKECDESSPDEDTNSATDDTDHIYSNLDEELSSAQATPTKTSSSSPTKVAPSYYNLDILDSDAFECSEPDSLQDQTTKNSCHAPEGAVEKSTEDPQASSSVSSEHESETSVKKHKYYNLNIITRDLLSDSMTADHQPIHTLNCRQPSEETSTQSHSPSSEQELYLNTSVAMSKSSSESSPERDPQGIEKDPVYFNIQHREIEVITSSNNKRKGRSLSAKEDHCYYNLPREFTELTNSTPPIGTPPIAPKPFKKNRRTIPEEIKAAKVVPLIRKTTEPLVAKSPPTSPERLWGQNTKKQLAATSRKSSSRENKKTPTKAFKVSNSPPQAAVKVPSSYMRTGRRGSEQLASFQAARAAFASGNTERQESSLRTFLEPHQGLRKSSSCEMGREPKEHWVIRNSSKN